MRYGKELPMSVIARRLTICSTCPLCVKNVCEDCGCILTEKTRMVEEECPQNKW